MEKPKLVQGAAQESKGAVDANKNEVAKTESKVAEKPIASAQAQGLTQREAVYNEVLRVIREDKITVADKQAVKPLLNETHIKKICASLIAGFQGKKIALKETEANKKKLKDTKLMELYCLGLLNNWLRRDKRLNGTQSVK